MLRRGFLVAVTTITVFGTLGLNAGSVSPAFGQVDDPTRAVFMLETITQEDGRPRGVGHGTAFFISPEGAAITNSHVVYLAQHDPTHYQLIAIFDKELYAVDIVCASKVADPTKQDSTAGASLSRDVAEIKVVPSTLPIETWGYKFQTGEELTIATAHRGALPEFPILKIAGHPGDGDHIRVIGYGHISPIPQKWSAMGIINGLDRTSDGTEIFGIDFTSPIQPGNSGSPVLNSRNQVIGLATWFSPTTSNFGAAQSNSAFQNPCR